MNERFKQRKQIHLRNFDYKSSSFVYFITICSADKQPYFLNEMIVKFITDELNFRRNSNEIALYCYCIMPDHIHLLLSLNDDYQKSLSNWVAAFKRYIARLVNELFDIKPLWQTNFYDHVVRKDESLLEIAQYILDNPVRKGLVRDLGEHKYAAMVDPLPI